MKDIYLISDTHFGHRLIIKFSNRPFKNIKEMQKVLINNWNQEVNKNDMVIILGDFYAGNRFFSNFLVNNLDGEKLLIKGNHDYKYRYRRLLDTQSIKIYNKIEFSTHGHHFILTHKPLKNVPKQTINIHGHLHRRLISPKYDQNKYYNVAVEHNKYKPITIEKIVEDKLGTNDIDSNDLIDQIKYSNVNRQNQVIG